MTSTMTDPPSRPANHTATSVVSGSRPLGITCFRTVWKWLSPRLRAATTWSAPSASSIPSRTAEVKWLVGRRARTATGSTADVRAFPSGGGQHGQLEREDQHQHRRQPVFRHGDERLGDGGDGLVRRASLFRAAAMPRTTEISGRHGQRQDHQAERDPERRQHLVTTGVRLV